VSRAMETDFRRQLRVPESRGRTIHEGFDFDAVSASAADAAAVRNELGVGPADPLIVNVGRLAPWKGQDVFLRAFSRVLRERPTARAAIVGAAGDNQGGRAFERDLKELAAELGIADRVTFTGFRDDVAAFMAAADVCVHSSSEPEPFGRVIVEAMGAGRPVVATAAGGVLDIVDDGRTGTLVPPGDHEAMGAAVAEYLSDPDAAARMGAAARADVRDRFAITRHARAVQRLYDRLTEGGGHPVPAEPALSGTTASAN
jgi:glycosyltransferase involved in cell wall biosynthesis